jgi:nicotinamide-nucleotide amidase
VTRAGRSAADLCTLVGVDRDRLADMVATLIARDRTVAAAESLTAGLLAAVLAEIPGVSATLRGGIVCYATDLKSTLVGVDPDLLARRGAVDPEVARQLARGVRIRCSADIGIGLTGVAGPDPLDGIPPGTVFVAADLRGPRTEVKPGSQDPVVLTAELMPTGSSVSRWEVRAGAVRTALGLLEQLAAQ